MQLARVPGVTSVRAHPQTYPRCPSLHLGARVHKPQCVAVNAQAYKQQQVAVSDAASPIASRDVSKGGRVAERTGERSSGAQTTEGFTWTKQWYPVYVIENLDTSVPHKFELLGKSVAVWRNPVTGTWACVEDRCPHRAAPLSQGQVVKTTGELRCAYHGWTFDQQGKCTDVPASANPERICNMRGSCVPSRPVREAHGILWVWGESGPLAHMEAAAAPFATDGIEEFNSPEWEALAPWYQRFGPVSFQTQMDNTVDLAHTPFVHHGILGLNRNQAVRGFPVSATPADTLAGGFQASYAAASTNSDLSNVNSTFHPPAVHVGRTVNRTGAPTTLLLVRAPVAPGRILTISRTMYKKPAPSAYKWAYKLLPVWLFHLLDLAFGDQDYMIMHNQDRLVEQSGGPDKSYFIPDPTDKIVKQMMVWMKKAGPIPYPQGQTLPPALTPEQVMDHYSQHVAHCKYCQQGLATVRLVTVLAGLAAGLLAAAAAAQAAVAAVSPVAVPALPWLAVAAVVLGWVGWSAYKLQKSFFVGNCDHRRT